LINVVGKKQSAYSLAKHIFGVMVPPCERSLRWLGRVIRIDHQCIPRQALHWDVPGVKRGPGRPVQTGGAPSTRTC